MLTLSRGGPHVWISEAEAKQAGLVDNDWVEVFNVNGMTARRGEPARAGRHVPDVPRPGRS